MTAEEFVKERYPDARYGFIIRNGVRQHSIYRFCITRTTTNLTFLSTGANPKQAWSNAKKQIQEQEKKRVNKGI